LDALRSRNQVKYIEFENREEAYPSIAQSEARTLIKSGRVEASTLYIFAMLAKRDVPPLAADWRL
jgi:hypothetical protein